MNLRTFAHRFTKSLILFNRFRARPYRFRGASVAPGPERLVSVVDCTGCAELVSASADPRSTLPATCPICGRPTTEAIREYFLVTKRRESA